MGFHRLTEIRKSIAPLLMFGYHSCMQNNEVQITASQFLRSETAQAHHNIEGAMPVMNEGFTKEQYVELLKKLYGFYFSVESNLASQFLLQTLDFSYTERMKLEALKNDLKSFGLTEAEIQNLPKVSNDWLPQDLDSALGLMYVLEGSTLGGQVISRHLKNKLQIDDSQGLQFFSGYGPQTGFMWKSFQGILNQNLNNTEKMQRAADTAQTTFQKLGSWLKA